MLAAAVPKHLLRGVRVLDLSRVLAGPWCTQLLADLGAEVIKVEQLTGDDTRRWGPPFLETQPDTASYFTCCNRGKQSIALDLKQPGGLDVARRLCERSDVVVENFLPGTLDRLGMSYEAMRALNPSIVLASITGFGQTGPRRSQPGYDFAVQAMCGLMSYTGLQQPTKVGVAVVDIMTGMYATTAILAALVGKRSAHLDISLFDVGLAMSANLGASYMATGKAPGLSGNSHAQIAPYDVVSTRDGSMVLAVGNDLQFTRLCELLGMADAARRPEYATNAQRVVNRRVLLAELDRALATRTSEEWVDLLSAGGVPCAPVNSIERALSDPQAIARGARIRGSAIDGVACAVRHVVTPAEATTGANATEHAVPRLSEHTTTVLTDTLGFTAEQIDALRKARAIL